MRRNITRKGHVEYLTEEMERSKGRTPGIIVAPGEEDAVQKSTTQFDAFNHHHLHGNEAAATTMALAALQLTAEPVTGYPLSGCLP